MVQIDAGFVVIVLNSATVYVSVSKNGTIRTIIEGTLHPSIKGFEYKEGYITMKIEYNITLGTYIYTPNGKIVV